MVDIDEMGQEEIRGFLQEVGFGHLGYIHSRNKFRTILRHFSDPSSR